LICFLDRDLVQRLRLQAAMRSKLVLVEEGDVEADFLASLAD